MADSDSQKPQTPDYEIQKAQLSSELRRIQQLLKDKTDQNAQLQTNYNALLEKITDLLPTINAAVKKSIEDSNEFNELKDIINKIDNEDLKKLINEKAESIENKIDNIKIPELPKPRDIDLTDVLKEAQETT
ncbi:5907_t:CDS:2 [Racocetra persica]|uniref:5907_t:CDS:1 n=1 Tax=Racocetra persica TaxID=160502 RepID=A0ACA9SPX8_9GLOM|nr:5907_t:CDS:2 [Racocetra persica]